MDIPPLRGRAERPPRGGLLVFRDKYRVNWCCIPTMLCYNAYTTPAKAGQRGRRKAVFVCNGQCWRFAECGKMDFPDDLRTLFAGQPTTRSDCGQRRKITQSTLTGSCFLEYQDRHLHLRGGEPTHTCRHGYANEGGCDDCREYGNLRPVRIPAYVHDHLLIYLP